MSERPGSRRFIVGSPFDASPALEPPDEHYAVHDRVTHDRYSLGWVTAFESTTAVVVDIGPRPDADPAAVPPNDQTVIDDSGP